MKEYEPQVLWLFVVMPKIQYVDFISYCPDLEIRPYHKIVIKREELEKEIAGLELSYIDFENKMDKLIKTVKTF